VNQLGLEEYLFGVVPAELPPATYPEPAALAAQAVAARTFALKNFGRFRADGFDLTADDRSQVYGGAGIEKPATNRAVDETRGVAIYYQGSPIEAMYSSTCGGRTEDFAAVFDKPALPYLVGVECAVESATQQGAILRGRHEVEDTFYASDGSVANRNLELARVLGLTAGRAFAPEQLRAPAERVELRAWVDAARALAHAAAPPPADAGDIATRAGFLRHAAESLFGAAEIAARVSPADVGYYLGNLKDGDAVPARARAALAFLIERRMWLPLPDNAADPVAPVRRGDALAWLARWIEGSPGETLRSGVLERVEGAELVVRWAGGSRRFPVADALRLFRADGSRSTAVSTLQVIGSEKVRFHVPPDGRIDFLEVELNAAGAASDRFSPQATWQTRLLRTDVAEKLRPLAPGIGDIVDLVPARFGSSGRSVAIRIEGTRQSAVLNGYRVRLALGLRDTLFSLSRSRSPDGRIESFTFDGRGWGHGVGLCQVGAVGMARAGKSYEEILKTYYRGVELRKVY
jgi:stage II sporulation protein D